MTLFVNVFSETVILALYIFVCLSLLKPRFKLSLRVLIYGGVVLCSCGAATALSLSRGGVMTALTLLPLIVYLPFSICAYILSKSGLFETAAACSVAALAALIIKTLKKILWILFSLLFGSDGVMKNIVTAAALLVLAAGTAYVVFRFMRRPFGVCAGSDMKNRLLILIPVVTVFLIIFINLNTAVSVAFSIMTLVMAVSFFVITTLLFIYYARVIAVTENEKNLSESLNLQRENFERVYQRVEAGRYYRHDMRHHLKVLSGMAQQNNSVEILEYIEELDGSAELCSPEIFCKNPAINAVLSEYIKRAENIGCRPEHKILIPEELPFDLPDVCIILSNALENAINACEKCPEDKRFIDLLVDFSDERKLKISVRNSCADTVEINAEGLPVIESRTDGHGIGLCGVKKTVEKYNGFIFCTCEDGVFFFGAEIFSTPNSNTPNSQNNGQNTERGSKRSKAIPAVLTLLVCTLGVLNFSPATASALSEALSVDIKTLSYGWGGSSFSIGYPEFAGNDSDKLNETAKDFIAEARKIFQHYTLQKYEGYVAEDAGYRIHMNNRTYISARFYATVNLGDSLDYSRCVTIDKQSGEVLTLADLFDEDRDYIGEISAEVLRQMEFRVQYEDADYFIPGGIWEDDECFKEISPDQEFYLNHYGYLVIVFEEYTVAPGKEGSPEFVLPDEIYKFDVSFP